MVDKYRELQKKCFVGTWDVECFEGTWDVEAGEENPSLGFSDSLVKLCDWGFLEFTEERP